MALNNIKDKIKSNYVLRRLYEFIHSFLLWFLNHIISAIPFWTIRKLFYLIYGIKIGHGARIGLHTRIISPSKIVIGNCSIINEYCHLDGRGGLIIGENCSISIYTKIITASHRANSDNFEYYETSVILGDHVWIGCNAIILDGSVIKNGCIIGAGAVVKQITDENGIYVGNPVAKIKERRSNLNYQISFHPFFK